MNDKKPDPKPKDIEIERPVTPPSNPQPDTTDISFDYRRRSRPSSPQIDAGIWED